MGDYEVASLLWPRLRVQQYYREAEIDNGCQWKVTRWAFIASESVTISDIYCASRAVAARDPAISQALQQARKFVNHWKELLTHLAIATSIQALNPEEEDGVVKRQLWANDCGLHGSARLQRCVDELGSMILQWQHPIADDGGVELLRLEFLQASMKVWDVLQFDLSRQQEETDLVLLSRWHKAATDTSPQVAILCAAWVELGAS